MLRTKRMSRCSNNAKLVDLPIDILINILLRLPAKSLCCTQCVCKTLLHIVEARSFATLVHLRLLNTASDAVAEVPQLLLLNVARDGDNGSLITISPSQIYDGNVLTKSRHAIVSKIASYRYGYNVGFVFCNLFFFNDKRYDRGPCFIFNPLRGEVLMLPKSTVQVPPFRNMIFIDWYGMGFDDITNTYKIVRVSGNERCCLVAQVYILGTSSWKRISSVPPCNLSTKKISAYGDLHWLINRSSTRGQICIVSFDFEKEEFYLTPHPALRKPEYSFLSLHFVNLRGSMAIVDTSSHTHIDIWVLKSYEKKEWVRDYSVNLELPGVERPWHLDRCGTCIGEWENGIFFVEFYVTTNAFFVDTRCDSVKRVSLGGSEYTRIFNYPGSLISLKLPLAIKCLGKLMHRKKTIGEWQNVLDSKIWDLRAVKQEVFRPLLLSYYELTPIVKRCLLYCATFPKNYQFNKHNLIDLWMSQDYLSGKEYKEKEEMGEYVFDTLVMQSFFQDVEEEVDDWDDSITLLCKMHDIVHDFMQFLNKNECFTMEAKEANTRMMVISEEVRHLSLMYAPYSSPLLDFIPPVNCKKLRTLATFDSKMSSIDIKAISQLKCLRTLNLSDNGIEELPEEIGELIHLRYLDLSENDDLEKLADSLGNLYNLQTLRLTGCWGIRTLPENMGNLINLRHLHTEGCKLEYLPRGIGRLTSLQTLNRCPVNHDSGPSEGLKLGDLGSLDQLQGTVVILIEGNLKDTASEAQKARLWNKKLCTLVLRFPTLDKQSHVQVLEALRPHQDLQTLLISGYGGTTEPSWMISLQNLRFLFLQKWDGCEFLPPLGKLPFLEKLYVEGMEKVKTVGDEFLGITDTQTSSSSSSVLFPKLEELRFEQMGEWEQWEGVGGRTESSGAEISIMPCLVSFKIMDCPKLMNLPLFLQNTPVSEIRIGGCRQSIITPVWPENCFVYINGKLLNDPEIPNSTERVETEILIDSQRDEEITMSPVETEIQILTE